MTLQQQIDIEQEIKLLETKLKDHLKQRGTATKIKNETGIDYTQLSDYKAGRRKFSLKRLLRLNKIIGEK